MKDPAWRVPLSWECAAQPSLRVDGRCPASLKEPILLGLQRATLWSTCRKSGVSLKIRRGNPSCCPSEQQPEPAAWKQAVPASASSTLTPLAFLILQLLLLNCHLPDGLLLKTPRHLHAEAKL